MIQYNPLQYLPCAEELPDSDDTIELPQLDNYASTDLPTLKLRNPWRNLYS
ncbi:MAG TPA: hypothetical protein V6D14_29280 [Coleofasciculaceae cyanobacterium]|jgi:hypothetical protein